MKIVYNHREGPNIFTHYIRFSLSWEYTSEAGHAPNEAVFACHTAQQCNLPRNKKCEYVDTRGSMLTADLTCAALTLAGAHFDGPTANGSGCAAHEANRGCSHMMKLAIYTSASHHTEAALFDARLAVVQVYSRLYMGSSTKIATIK